MQNIIPLPRTAAMDCFYNDYFLKEQAVVVEGAARLMPAFTRWTDDYLRQIMGEERALVRLPDRRFARMRFADILDYLAAPEKYNSSIGTIYLTDYMIWPTMGDERRITLAPDAACPLACGKQFAGWTALYAGPPNTASGMHQDVFETHTWLAELRGEKTWRLCAPKDLQPGLGNRVNAFGDESIGCDVFEAILQPGDVIYLPPNWWHQVRNETTSTMAISGNFCTYGEIRAAIKEVEENNDVGTKNKWIPMLNAILAQENTALEIA